MVGGEDEPYVWRPKGLLKRKLITSKKYWAAKPIRGRSQIKNNIKERKQQLNVPVFPLLDATFPLLLWITLMKDLLVWASDLATKREGKVAFLDQLVIEFLCEVIRTNKYLSIPWIQSVDNLCTMNWMITLQISLKHFLEVSLPELNIFPRFPDPFSPELDHPRSLEETCQNWRWFASL